MKVLVSHMCKETVPSIHNRAGTHMNSQRLWQDVKYLYKFKPDNISAQRTGSGQELPPRPKSYSPLTLAWVKKICFLQSWIIRSIPSHPKKCFMNRVIDQHKMNSIGGELHFLFYFNNYLSFGVFYLLWLTYSFFEVGERKFMLCGNWGGEDLWSNKKRREYDQNKVYVKF